MAGRDRQIDEERERERDRDRDRDRERAILLDVWICYSFVDLINSFFFKTFFAKKRSSNAHFDL